MKFKSLPETDVDLALLLVHSGFTWDDIMKLVGSLVKVKIIIGDFYKIRKPKTKKKLEDYNSDYHFVLPNYKLSVFFKWDDQKKSVRFLENGKKSCPGRINALIERLTEVLELIQPGKSFDIGTGDEPEHRVGYRVRGSR